MLRRSLCLPIECDNKYVWSKNDDSSVVKSVCLVLRMSYGIYKVIWANFGIIFFPCLFNNIMQIAINVVLRNFLLAFRNVMEIGASSIILVTRLTILYFLHNLQFFWPFTVFLIGIHSMHSWTATSRYEFPKKKHKKIKIYRKSV